MTGGWTEVAGLGGAGIAAIVLGGTWRRLRRRARLLSLTRDVTLRYARLLSVKQKQLVIHDGYGNYQLRPWIDHVGYFLDNVVLREARSQGLVVAGVRQGSRLRSKLVQVLLATLHAQDDAGAGPVGDEEIISGEHYETLCRNLLQAQGWRVDTTPVTGDQGADLIAEADGRRVVIQCKFYARPVGNKAVQEAHAALGFHAGDRAAVVSNATFTRSAHQLARANDVLLLHHDQLGDLARLVREAENVRRGAKPVRP